MGKTVSISEVVDLAEQAAESQIPAQPPVARKARAGRRAPRSPLTLHPTGQYCKKIRGKIYYFGKDRQEALKRYYEQASTLHTATSPRAALLPNKLTLENLCNLYLDHQLGRAKTGEIRERQYHEQKPRLKAFANFIGRDRLVAEIKTIELLAYRKKRIEDGRAPVTINNELAVIKAMFHWAEESEIIERGPRLNAVKKIPRKKIERQTFTPEEVHRLLAAATIAAGTGDVFAVQGILGHADLAMASAYAQQNRLTPQTDRAIEHAQKWLNGSVTNPDDSE